MSPRGAGAGAIGVLLIAAIGLWAAAVPSESTGTQSVDAARGRTTTTRAITPDDDRPDRDPADTTAPTSADPAPPPTAPKRPSDERLFHEVFTISGDISPKSVVASDDGLFFAQNMMYRHTITVYDRNFELVKTIGDQVRLEEFGLDGPGAPVQGAPVEAAFAPDGAYAYVSNYSMYGPGFAREGSDSCTSDAGLDDSFVYRVDVKRLEIDQVIPVGAVPKYVAVTPDGRFVLVTNWCSYDMSVIDASTGKEVRRIPIGRYPRGIAVDPGSTTAFVAVMGGTEIATVNLADFSVGRIAGVGDAPRHLVMAPDGRYLYATLNDEGVVARIDLADGNATTKISTGRAPRSMDISADGRSLYVVNYESNTVSKVRTADMKVLQEVPVGFHPIGITYDDPTGDVWVACYSGTIHVFRDS
jgi:YVTN family beta-propeller protein